MAKNDYMNNSLFIKGNTMKKQLFTLMGLLCFCTSAMAAPLYFGGGFGKVDYDTPNFDNPTGVELIVGSDINHNLSIEASYIDFGEADDGIPPVWRINATGLTVGALVKAPVSQNLDFFLKLGLNSWDAELTEDGFGVLATDDGTDTFYGIGATLYMNNNISLGARYNVYDFDGDDVTMFSINLFVGI